MHKVTRATSLGGLHTVARGTAGIIDFAEALGVGGERNFCSTTLAGTGTFKLGRPTTQLTYWFGLLSIG